VNTQQLELVRGGTADTQASRIQTLIDELRRNSALYKAVQIINSREDTASGLGDAEESLDQATFFSLLIEDGKKKTAKAKKLTAIPRREMSYIDFLCWLHKMIQNKFYN